MSAGPMAGELPWWHGAVVYQVYPRSFADASGDGVGDLRGVTSRLDYLAGLGVDVVWLSPFFRSPQDDFGYDVSDYRDVDPLFGTLADCDELIAEAHARGLRVMFDMVFNHTSDEHPWFADSRRGGDKRDWYYWAPARPGHEPGAPGAEPTNLGSMFGGPAWQFDAERGEYYLHLFSRKQPDLNWHRPEVRAALADVCRFWVARGVDGFRFDVINFIGKRAGGLADGPASPNGLSYDYAALGDTELVHTWLQELNRAAFVGHDLITVGEMPGVTVEEARRYTDPANRELDMVFTFEHVSLDQGDNKWDLRPLALPALKANLARWQAGLADVGWNSLYLSNHDQPRIVSRWGDDSPRWRVPSARAWATVLHLLKGTPYVYQGDEIGMTGAGFTAIEQYADIESRTFYAQATGAGLPAERALAALRAKSRDNARTPMQWDATPGAGFSLGEPWLALNPNHAEINVADQVGDEDSVYAHVRNLIQLRHSLTLVREGPFELLLPEHEQLFAYTRRLGGQVLLVVANLSGDDVRVPPESLPPLAGGRLVLSSYDDGTIVDSQERLVSLRPWESRVYLWV